MKNQNLNPKNPPAAASKGLDTDAKSDEMGYNSARASLPMNKRLIITAGTILLLITGTLIAIRYAEGYRLSRQQFVKSTGLLSANSFPNGASVYINGNLTTATDSTLNLTPGEYDVEIRKEGFFSWKKKLKLEPELVTQTNALLFATAPGLTPLTFTGAQNIQPSPDGQRILFITASASAARNNGLYTLDLTDNPLALQKGPRQIARNGGGIDLSKATYLWSPNSDQILVMQGSKTFLLDAGRMTDLDTARDVTVSLNDTLTTWKQLADQKLATGLARFPKEIQKLASASAKNLYLSPDQDRLMYTTTADLILPDQLIPPVPASNSQPQDRKLKAGNVYVYDLREDRNFMVQEDHLPAPSPTPKPAKAGKTTAVPALPASAADTSVAGQIAAFQNLYSGLTAGVPQWLPDSKHIIFLDTAAIRISEYDGTNMTQVYSGPLSGNFVYPWPNGTKLLILTNFNQGGDVPVNLYAVSLR